jgi:hypothetical protein
VLKDAPRRPFQDIDMPRSELEVLYKHYREQDADFYGKAVRNMSLADFAEAIISEIRMEFEDSIKRFASEIFPQVLLFTYTRHRADKFSFHIRCTSHYCGSSDEQNLLQKDLLQHVYKDFHQFIDNGVCKANTNIALPFEWNKGHQLVPQDCDDIENALALYENASSHLF